MILLLLLLLSPLPPPLVLLYFLFLKKLESQNGRWCQASAVTLYIGRLMTKKWWFYLTHKDRQLTNRRRKKTYPLGEHWRKSEQRNRPCLNEKKIMNLKTIGIHFRKVIRYGDFFTFLFGISPCWASRCETKQLLGNCTLNRKFICRNVQADHIKWSK